VNRYIAHCLEVLAASPQAESHGWKEDGLSVETLRAILLMLADPLVWSHARCWCDVSQDAFMYSWSFAGAASLFANPSMCSCVFCQ
jgi:hypothetical protein